MAPIQCYAHSMAITFIVLQIINVTANFIEFTACSNSIYFQSNAKFSINFVVLINFRCCIVQSLSTEVSVIKY